METHAGGFEMQKCFFQACQTPTNNIRLGKSVWAEIEDVSVEPDHFIDLFLLKNKDNSQKVNGIVDFII